MKGKCFKSGRTDGNLEKLFDNRKNETFLTTEEIAIRLNVSPKTIRKWRYERFIPDSCMLKLRSQVRYRLESVLAWLESQQKETKA